MACSFIHTMCVHKCSLQPSVGTPESLQGSAHDTCAKLCVSHAGCDRSHNHLKEQKHILTASILSCMKHLLRSTPPCNVCMHLQSILYASPMCVFSAQVSGLVINERGWMASAGHDNTTERKSFIFSWWTADSELKGVWHRLLKS